MSKLPSGLVNEAVNEADEAEPMRSARVPIQVEVVGTSATSSRKPKGTPQQQGASARRRSNKAAEVELERQRAESKAMRKRASIDFVMMFSFCAVMFAAMQSLVLELQVFRIASINLLFL